MAKKIRFPLAMDNGIEVRSMDELKNNFSIACVLEYAKNGKLVIWLRDRYENEIADEVEQLNSTEENFAQKLSEIFDVPYDDKEAEIIEEKAERIARMNILKNYTDEQKYLEQIDKVAFDQDEMYDLLDTGEHSIYLCGEKFSIPLSKQDITYIGINKPVVELNTKTIVNWEEKRIKLVNVIFDSKYQEMVEEQERQKYQEEQNSFFLRENKLYSIDSLTGKNNQEYEFKESLWPDYEYDFFEGIAKDGTEFYVLKENNIVKVNVENGDTENIFTLDDIDKCPYILSVRKNKLFLMDKSRWNDYTTKLLVLNLLTNRLERFELHEIIDFCRVYIDTDGKKAYFQISDGNYRLDKICEYDFEKKQINELISGYFNGMEYSQDKLIVWGCDSERSAYSKSFYMYDSKTKKMETQNFFERGYSVEGMTYKDGNIYFLRKSGAFDRYLYKIKKIGDKEEYCARFSIEVSNNRIYEYDGYLYGLYEEEGINRTGCSLKNGYVLSALPHFRIRLDTYEVEKY